MSLVDVDFVELMLIVNHLVEPKWTKVKVNLVRVSKSPNLIEGDLGIEPFELELATSV